MATLDPRGLELGRTPRAACVSVSSLVILFLLAASTLLGSAAGAEVLTLEAERDNTLFEDAEGDTSNGSGPSLFAGRNSQGRVRRALVWFDVESSLPPGALVDSATLQLHLSSSSDPSPRATRVHRVLANWGEGASVSSGGGGATAEFDDATWLNTFFPGAFWSSTGGDFALPPSASATVAGEGDWAWRDPQLTADVQAWLAEGGNHGWVVISDETVPGTARRFDSREYSNPDRRPRLTLHYSMVTQAVPHSWGGLKHRYRK
jgi:hypothetical protein